jgi:hypothetical protein
VIERVIDAGDYRVVVVQTHLFRYTLTTLVAWPLSLVLMDDSGGLAPTKKYRIAVQAVESGEHLWHEEGAGDQALSDAEEMAAQIVRIGIEDFLFKKEHGWRID